CEGMSNAILCFNVKNLRYAVGNVVVGQEQFARVKKMMIEWLVKEIEENKKIEIDIYSIGCRTV
ncbi:MAG: hypothetical protein WCT31_02640, partial [Candidatus Micrarchaeia archaeon]